MACLYKRRNRLWVSYYVGGRQVQKSLHTDDERGARATKRRIEHELDFGEPATLALMGLGGPGLLFCRRRR